MRLETKPRKRAKNTVAASPVSWTGVGASSSDCVWVNSSLRTSAAIHSSGEVETGIDTLRNCERTEEKKKKHICAL
jgi:hypothetical protein